MKNIIKEIKAVIYFSDDGGYKGHLIGFNLQESVSIKECNDLYERFSIDVKTDHDWINKELALEYIREEITTRFKSNGSLHSNAVDEKVLWIFETPTDRITLNGKLFILYDDSSYGIIEGDGMIGTVMNTNGTGFKGTVMMIRDK